MSTIELDTIETAIPFRLDRFLWPVDGDQPGDEQGDGYDEGAAGDRRRSRAGTG